MMRPLVLFSPHSSRSVDFLQHSLSHITCPLLVIMGRLDRLIPPADAERMVQEAAGEAELWMFEDGNHVCNNIPYKHRPQQADWMRRKLMQ
jgi:pimeloyl-ACP methyl ester carboxylesterase